MHAKYEAQKYLRLIEKTGRFLELLLGYGNGDRKLIEDAYHFACDAHRTQKRKASGEPYAIHVIDVAVILMEERQPARLVAAGLLHDTVEDFKYTGITEAVLEKEFGSLVAGMVMDVTEKDKTVSWQQRKDHAIGHIANAGRESKILKCADKLSNVSSMTEEYEALGDAMWSMGFKGTMQDHKRNFQRIASVLDDISDTGIYQRYMKSLEYFCGL